MPKPVSSAIAPFMDKKKITLLSLGHLSCDVNGGALPAILPFLREAYGLTYQATGGLMFAFSCLSSVIQPLFGLLADKLSKPWFIPLGILLAGLGIGCIGWLGDYWSIFFAVIVSGIGASLFHPEGARYANKVSGEQKGTGLSIFSIGGNSGFVLGPLLATGFIGFFGLGGTSFFAILAIFTAALIFRRLAWLAGRAEETGGQTSGTAANCKPVAKPESSDQASGKTSGNSQTLPQNNWRAFGKLTMIIVVRSTMFISMNTFIPLYMAATYGLGKTGGAMALIVFCTAGICSNLLGGILADRFGYLTLIRLGSVLMAPAVLALTMVNDLALAFCLLPLVGFALYAPFSSLVVTGQKLLARNIGFASGVTLGLATSIGGMAAPGLGWIADTWGLGTAMTSLGVIGIVAAVFAFWLKPGDMAGKA